MLRRCILQGRSKGYLFSFFFGTIFALFRCVPLWAYTLTPKKEPKFSNNTFSGVHTASGRGWVGRSPHRSVTTHWLTPCGKMRENYATLVVWRCCGPEKGGPVLFCRGKKGAVMLRWANFASRDCWRVRFRSSYFCLLICYSFSLALSFPEICVSWEHFPRVAISGCCDAAQFVRSTWF